MNELLSTRWQLLLLVVLVLASLAITNVETVSEKSAPGEAVRFRENVSAVTSGSINFAPQETYAAPRTRGTGEPVRRWDVLDPTVRAAAVLIQSLEGRFPFLHMNITRQWPIASLTKLLTAVTVMENIGPDKKIPITLNAVQTEGVAGNLKQEEIYTARDLLIVMLLTSSNDAATAFEDYAGGKDEFSSQLNEKARVLGMQHTIVHDASGLSDLNTSTPEDLAILMNYISKNVPDILAWTRLEHFLVQPTNVGESKTLTNINPLVTDPIFLGGKTGTSPESRENLASIITVNGERLIVVILGSPDRVNEFDQLITWLHDAYTLL